jgi:uncharacterized protein (DUF1330 family)
MSATMIAVATLNPEHKEQAAAYSEGVKPVLMAFGGKPVARYAISDQLVGEQAASVILAVSFDSADSAKAFLNSEAYQALIPLREAGFSSMQIYLSEG